MGFGLVGHRVELYGLPLSDEPDKTKLVGVASKLNLFARAAMPCANMLSVSNVTIVRAEKEGLTAP